MGLLDGILDGGQPQRKPGLGGTLAAGVVLALLVKAVRQYQASHGGPPGQGDRSFEPQGRGAPRGGILGGLGGLLGGGGGGLGGMLGGLGGAGALGSLIGQFQQKGHGQQVNSWVGHGPNEPIAPNEVRSVLGEDTLELLQRQSGLPRDQLLAQLAQELPQAINAATPQGRPPADDDELQAAAQQPARDA